MATLGTYINLADTYKLMEQDDLRKVADIIEMLEQTNPILQDAPAYPCNLGTKERVTIRTSLPAPTWRILYRGTANTKSTTGQYDDTTGMLEALSAVDEALLEIVSDKAAFRLSEAAPHLEGMNQEAASSIFYANTGTDPEEILGLAPRFDSLSQVNSSQIIDAAGVAGDNTSIWFVVWGRKTCHLLYPAASNGGISHMDMGKQRVLDGSSNAYYAFEDQYKWQLGLTVKDWRYVVRIANIDVTDLTNDASAGANLFDTMVQAYWRLHHRRVPGGMAAVYANPTIMEFLDHQSRQANAQVQLRWTEAGPDSEPVLRFRNMPIREVDALIDTEVAVA
jgi:hypothetical protein